MKTENEEIRQAAMKDDIALLTLGIEWLKHVLFDA
jgi:hypothetical protein